MGRFPGGSSTSWLVSESGLAELFCSRGVGVSPPWWLLHQGRPRLDGVQDEGGEPDGGRQAGRSESPLGQSVNMKHTRWPEGRPCRATWAPSVYLSFLGQSPEMSHLGVRGRELCVTNNRLNIQLTAKPCRNGHYWTEKGHIIVITIILILWNYIP